MPARNELVQSASQRRNMFFEDTHAMPMTVLNASSMKSPSHMLMLYRV